MDNKDLVSIIVPVYNAEKYILETIASVQAQDYENWELLLVEDRSKDNTVAVVEQFLKEKPDKRVCLVRQPENGGAAKARNRGLKEAQGRYIAFLDADDKWEPDKLSKQMAFVREKDAAFCFTGYEFADENCVGLGKIVKVPPTLTYKEALKNTTIFTSTVMFDTEKISKDKLEMPIIKSEDTALWWRLLRQGYTAYGLDANLVKYRRAGKTLSSNKFEAMRRIWNLYRRAEGMGILNSAIHFCFWAFNAVRRRV